LSGSVLLFGLWATVIDVFDGFLLFLGEFVVLLSAESFAVVRLVVLSEGIAIDSDDGALDQGLGSDQLVGSGVVNDIDDPGGPGNAFTSPTEVTVVQSKSSEFHVAAHSSNGVNSLGRDFSVGSWSTEFKLSFFVHLWLSATGLSSLVP